MSPSQVRSKLYCTFIVVAVRCSNAHCLDIFHAANLLNDNVQCVERSLNIVFNVGIGLRLNGRCSLNLASAIHDSEYRVRSTQV